MKANERLKQVREEQRLTQTEMASKLKMQLTSYNHIERGRNNISPRVALLIKLLFGVREEWLLDGQGEKFDSAIDIYDNRSSLFDFSVKEPDVDYGPTNDFLNECANFDNIEMLRKKYKLLLGKVTVLQKEVNLYKKIIDKLT